MGPPSERSPLDSRNPRSARFATTADNWRDRHVFGAADARGVALVGAVGYGLLAFPAVVGSMLATPPTTASLAGFPVGVVPGDAGDGWLAGLQNGASTGVDLTLLSTALVSIALVSIALVSIALVSIAPGVERSVAGGFGGPRYR